MGEISKADAEALEAEFLGHVRGAQSAYERFVEAQGWLALGHETYAAWWQLKVVPLMRGLDFRPTKELAVDAAGRIVVDQPTLSAREVGRQVGLDHKTVAKITNRGKSPIEDLDRAIDEFVGVRDLDGPGGPVVAGGKVIVNGHPTEHPMFSHYAERKSAVGSAIKDLAHLACFPAFDSLAPHLNADGLERYATALSLLAEMIRKGTFDQETLASCNTSCDAAKPVRGVNDEAVQAWQARHEAAEAA